MISVEQQVPLAAPLFFLVGGLVIVFMNRRAFTDFDGAIRDIAEQRARSRFLRMAKANKDVETEYEDLRKIRWVLPVAVVGYFGAVIWMLVIAVRQM